MSILLKCIMERTASSGMSHKGSFSYHQDTVNYVRISPKVTVHVARIDSNVARLYMVGNDNAVMAVPTNVHLEQGGARVPVFHDSFMITWANDYHLYLEDSCVLTLENQEHQALTA
jgi:hypothetical protein